MSPMIADSQFQVETRHLSNLDRCNLCGGPRSAHGIDWTCSPGVSASRARSVLLVVAAGLLALAGVGLLTVTSATEMTLGTLGASACLAGLTLLVCCAAIAGRRR